jgi:rhodanese-related sulfurtransferase
MEPSELLQRLTAQSPVTVVDTRRKAAFRPGGPHIPGALRLEVDEIPERARDIPPDRPVVLYCA